MTRRLVALVAAGVLAATLAACDSGNGGDAGTSTRTAASGASQTAVTESSRTAVTEPGTAASGSSSSSAMSPSGSPVVSGPGGTNGAAGPADPRRPVDQLRLTDMLALIPDRTVYRQQPVAVNLYWKAASAGGVTVPGGDADGDAALRYYQAMLTDLDRKIGMASSDLFTDIATDLTISPGFGLRDVAADVQAPAAGGPIGIAARGRFDLGAIDTALRGNNAWRPYLTTSTYRGCTIYRWLDDRQRVAIVGDGLLDNGGLSRRLSFPDSSTLVFARRDVKIRELLDSWNGAAPSIAGDEQYEVVAAALDRHGVYSAVFQPPLTVADTVAGVSPLLMEGTKAKLRARIAKHTLQPYRLAGLGETLSDGQPQTILVLVNADAAAARKNATAIKDVLSSGTSLAFDRPWSDIYTVQSVIAKGPLTIAVLLPSPREEGGPANVFSWRPMARQNNLLTMAG